MKKRALISVSDKSNLIEFAKCLIENNYEIISTGGTLDYLLKNNITAIAVSQVSGFPEILDGRVKTLHPNIHGGLLSIRANEEHKKQMLQNKIDYIDFVIVNLYPFKQTVVKENINYQEIIEQIDIGGPSMLRSAAKNHNDVTVIVDVNDYEKVKKELNEKGNTSLETRKYLAVKVFQHTSAYDTIIAEYLNSQLENKQKFPNNFTITYDKIMDLRYGENPHQNAAFYKHYLPTTFSIANAIQLQGKELSYNNIQDSDAALNLLQEFENTQPVCIAVKHNNPCGVAIGINVLNAWNKTLNSDSTSIFGGIIVFNQKVDNATAIEMNKIFLEIIIAPDFTEEALKTFELKKNLRVLKIDISKKSNQNLKITNVAGGLLVQDFDTKMILKNELKLVTNKNANEDVLKDLIFAWKIVKHVKSNAIVIAKNETTLGIGAGQMNRVGAAKIALEQAKNNYPEMQNTVLSSDAFFPFDDVVALANNYNIKAIIQPGGSIKDKDSIDACNKFNIAMYFTNIRHFKH